MPSVPSRRRARLWRELVVAGVVLSGLGMVAAAGYYVFTGWRARSVATSIDTDRLVPGEYALVLPLRAGAPAIGE